MRIQLSGLKSNILIEYFNHLQNSIWEWFENNPLFAHSYEEQSLDKTRELAVRRIKEIVAKEFVSASDVS